jgi:hypothetical protein
MLKRVINLNPLFINYFHLENGCGFDLIQDHLRMKITEVSYENRPGSDIQNVLKFI